jgi:hypothetical protein
MLFYSRVSDPSVMIGHLVRLEASWAFSFIGLGLDEN